MAKKRYITIAIIVVVSIFLAYLQFVQCRCNTDDAGTYAYMYNYFELGNKELGLKTFLNPWFFCSAIAYLLNIGGSGTFSSLAYISFWYGIAVFLTLLLIMHNKDSRWLLAFAAFILLPYRTTNKYHMVVAFVTLFAIWALQLYEDNRKKWILFLVGFVSIYTLLFTDDRLLLVLFLFVPLSVYLIILLFQDYDKRKYLYVAFWGVALVAGILKIIDMITIKISGQGLGIMEAMGGYGGVDYYNWIDVENFFSKGIPSLFSSLLIQWNVPIEGGMIQFKSFYWIIRIIIAGLALAALISRWIEILKKGLKSIALLDSLSVICTTVVLAFNMCNGMIKYYNIKGAPMNRYASVCWFLLVVILARWLDERYGATMIFHNISNNSFLGVVFILLSIGYVNPVFVPSEDIINSGFAFEIDFLKEHGDTYKYGLGSHWKSVPVTAATNAEYVVCKALIEDDKFVCGKSDGFYRDGGNYFNFIVSDGNNDMTISHENINKIRGNYIEAYSDEDTIYVYDYDVRFDTTVVMDTAGMGYELTDTITYYLDLPVGSSRIELTTAAKDNLLLNVLENDEIANVRIDNKGDDIATIEITCLQNTQIGLSVGRREDIPTILYKIEIKRTAGAVFVDKEQTKLPLNEGRYIVTFSGEDLKDMKINWKIDGEVTQLTNGRIKRRYLIDISRKQDIEYEIVTMVLWLKPFIMKMKTYLMSRSERVADLEKRQSNFELLRIVCMLLIMGLHITRQTKMGDYLIGDGVDYYYSILLGSAGRFVCNTFVMIGAWFLVDTKFRAERVVNLWMEIFLYAVSITVICIVIGCKDANITTLIQACFPIFGRPVWFGSEYICLLLLTPWLNEMLMEKNQQKTKQIIKLFGILIIGCATLFPIEHVTPAFSELIWFCFLYLFIGLYKRYQFFKYQWFEKYSLLWFIVGYLFLCGIRVLANYLNHEGLYRIFIHYYAHYEALLGFICSLALFFIFKNWNIRPNRFVNLVSRSTFAVYIIHQTPAFYNYMWNGIFRIDPAVESGNGIVYSLFVIAAIFVVSVCVDNVRIFVMDRSIYKCKVYRLVCKRLEEFYQ